MWFYCVGANVNGAYQPTTSPLLKNTSMRISTAAFFDKSGVRRNSVIRSRTTQRGDAQMKLSPIHNGGLHIHLGHLRNFNVHRKLDARHFCSSRISIKRPPEPGSNPRRRAEKQYGLGPPSRAAHIAAHMTRAGHIAIIRRANK